MSKQKNYVNLLKEYERLKSLSSSCERILSETGNCIPLHVHFEQRKGKPFCRVFAYVPGSNGKMQEKYVQKKNIVLNKGSVERYCAEHTLWKVKKAQHVLKTHPETYVSDDFQDLFLNFDLAFGKLVPAEFHSIRFLCADWASHYTRSVYRDEELIYKTKHGEYVRSKFEMMVANALLDLRIPYRYECKLTLGNRSYLPDFMLKNPRTGDVSLLEAFGMMDSPEYATNALQKLKDYQAHGYYLGKNLFAVFDCRDAPFETDLFKDMLREMMGM